jgi:hypothetical protein
MASDFPRENSMHLLGTFAFGAMTIVNLVVLGLVVVGVSRRIRKHS